MLESLPLLLAPLTLAAAATAQSPDIAVAEDTAEIIVEAGRKRAHEYRRMLGRAAFQGQLPRWQVPMCLRVVGLENPEAKARFTARIEQAAFDAGAPVGGPGCDSNVVVAWTGDGADLAQRVYRKRPRVLTDVTSDVKADFLRGDLPVRWVPRAGIESAGGTVTGSGGEAGIAIEGGTGGVGIDAPTVRYTSASLINSPIITQLQSVTVIIDAEQAAGVSLDALADHVALLALSGVPMGGRPAQLRDGESIMTLFESPEARTMQGMTSADRNYLAALYKARPDRLARWHRGKLVAAVEAGLIADGAATEDE